MNEKRRAIIEQGMRLFATKGYHSTAMQEIAENAGISKGGIYNHFSSKNELLVEIYRYYYKQIKEKMDAAVRGKDLTPKEMLQSQIEIYIGELLYKKEFILMHLNDNVGCSKEVEEFLQAVKKDSMKWYRESLIGIYGDQITAHTFDLTIMLRGMTDSYLYTLLRTNILLPVDELAVYLISRLDDLVEGLLKKREVPQLDIELNGIDGGLIFGEKLWRKQLYSYIFQLEKLTLQCDMNEEMRKDCLESIELLKEETEREKPRKIIFQGLLNNLALLPESKQIAENIFIILKEGNAYGVNRQQGEQNHEQTLS